MKMKKRLRKKQFTIAHEVYILPEIITIITTRRARTIRFTTITVPLKLSMLPLRTEYSRVASTGTSARDGSMRGGGLGVHEYRSEDQTSSARNETGRQCEHGDGGRG
jgi:hypothetical protein